MKRPKRPKSGISRAVRARHFDLDALNTTTGYLKPGQREQREQDANSARTAQIKSKFSDIFAAVVHL